MCNLIIFGHLPKVKSADRGRLIFRAETLCNRNSSRIHWWGRFRSCCYCGNSIVNLLILLISFHKPSEFDFFQTGTHWGYNGYLNQLCDISSPPHYFLSFQLEELIAPAQIIHTQAHHTPMYTTKSFRYRDEVVATNGENYTYHAGAYLGGSLHGGAITSAIRVAQLIGMRLESIFSVESKQERIPLA